MCSLLNIAYDIGTVTSGLLTGLLDSSDKTSVYPVRVVKKNSDPECDVNITYDSVGNKVLVMNKSSNPIIATFISSDSTKGTASQTILLDRGMTNISKDIKIFQKNSTISFLEVPQDSIEKNKNVQVVNFKSPYASVGKMINLIPGLSFVLHNDHVFVMNGLSCQFNISLTLFSAQPITSFTVSADLPKNSNTTINFPGSIDQSMQSVIVTCNTTGGKQFLDILRMNSKKRDFVPIHKFAKKENIPSKVENIPSKVENITTVKTNAKHPFVQMLKDMNEMGFTDKEQNIKVLIKAKGDITLAISFLLE